MRARRFVSALSVPVVLLVLAELVLRATGLDPAAEPGRRLFEEVVRDGVRCFQRHPPQNLPLIQAYPFDKPAGTVRIACIGGSTLAGHPTVDKAFYRVFERLLEQAVAPRDVELICAGLPGMYSDGELAVLRELIDRDLDAVVLYSLHNEFQSANVERLLAAEAEPWRTGLREALGRLAVGRWLLQLVSATPQVEPSVADSPPDHRPIDGPEYALVIEHARENLAAFAALCAERGVPLLLCTVISNLRDFPPLADVFDPRTGEAERARWSTLIGAAAAAAAQGDGNRALALLEDAEAIDGQPARLSFVRGQALLAAGRLDEARSAFRRARDTDGRLTRAVSELNELVRGLDGRAGVTVVDLERFFDERAPFGVTGREAVVDHVHPSVPAYALMAARLLQALADARLFTTREELLELGLYDPSANVQVLVDEADAAVRGGLGNLQLALEKGRWDDTAAQAHAELLDAVRLSSAAARALAGLGLLESLRQDAESSRKYFARALAADPHVLDVWRERAARSPLIATLLERAGQLQAAQH